MKSILKYIVIFVITVIMLFTLLVLTAMIPKSMIAENIKESDENERIDLIEVYALKERERRYLCTCICR